MTPRRRRLVADKNATGGTVGSPKDGEHRTPVLQRHVIEELSVTVKGRVPDHDRTRIPRARPRIHHKLDPGVLRDPTHGGRLGRKGPRPRHSQRSARQRDRRRPPAEEVDEEAQRLTQRVQMNWNCPELRKYPAQRCQSTSDDATPPSETRQLLTASTQTGCLGTRPELVPKAHGKTRLAGTA